jgi:cystathionine beta-synthase
MLLSREGVMAGSSTGTLLAAALRYCREQTRPKRVVTFACDTGNRYLSKLYNDFWLEDQGFVARKQVGDLRDLVGRPHGEHATMSSLTAHNRPPQRGFSQPPVMDGNTDRHRDRDDIIRFAFEDWSASTNCSGDERNVSARRQEHFAEQPVAMLEVRSSAAVMDGESFWPDHAPMC